MKIILTHEQADFDAIAALLGAHLVQESFLPVLPRRFNRNVNAFLSLYGVDLPFTDPRDLPPDPIDEIILVDTQSLVTLKGSGMKTSVQVIDHHQPRLDSPPHWVIHYDPMGAVTTLFVEHLQERDHPLNPIQATLLLLGIYEDTGSLTYASTTPRDIRAAAYLLEQGASLSLAARYLNPPLSPDQRKLYDALLAHAESFQVHGQKVVIACGSAEDMNEEVSTVAHKVRDLLDPDALFMLVTTSEGIRLVARSTTSQVNVAEIAAEFGGGGHERAAAALIRVETEDSTQAREEKNALLQTVCQRLKTRLPALIRPSITVRQMMSRRPRLISPQTSAQEAARLMQRYGYEGYPVVQGEKVIGLLTRRAVDRAISHKLDLPAASLMDAGEVVVHPHDSIEHLQQVMITSGWGQIPVADPQTHKIIGIVTRTDLLKTLSAPTGLPTPQALADRLDEALPPARLALLRRVAEVAHQEHAAVYIVGGFVRDLILGRPSLDFDVVVEGDAIALAHRVAEQYGGLVISHSRFGTAKWDIAGIRTRLAKQLAPDKSITTDDLPESLDLITARTEFYERPTALPTVERSSIKLDLHRRDFTINTMALRLDGHHYGELYDHWGGLSDLRQGLVRVLHSLSFIDDPTRALRAVRFEQRFGFQIETRTLQLIREAGPLIKQVSGDRIRHELNLILDEEKAVQMFKRLDELGILTAIYPGLPARLPTSARLGQPPEDWGIPPRSMGMPTRRLVAYLAWLSHLPAEQAAGVCQRLKFSRMVCETLDAITHLRPDLPTLVDAPPSAVVRRLGGISLPGLFAVYVTLEDQRLRELINRYVFEWQRIESGINGDKLREMGLPPGPSYRYILESLRDARLDGEIRTPEQELEWVQRIVEKTR